MFTKQNIQISFPPYGPKEKPKYYITRFDKKIIKKT